MVQDLLRHMLYDNGMNRVMNKLIWSFVGVIFVAAVGVIAYDIGTISFPTCSNIIENPTYNVCEVILKKHN
jgi:hypothetical protein